MVTSMRWAIADVAALPNLREDCRYEVIDGELHVSSQPDWRHQVASTDIMVVYRREEMQLRVVGTLAEGDLVQSPNLPGLSATVGELVAYTSPKISGTLL